MDPTYSEQYAHLYHHHWWWRAREALVLETLGSLPRISGPVLDVGCGDGLLFPRLATYGEIWGVEPEAAIVSPNTKRVARIHIGGFDEDFQPDCRFGLTLMLDVLEHMTDRPAALLRARDLTKTEGYLLLTVPALGWLWTSHDDINHHQTRYTREKLSNEVRAAGFEIDRCDYVFHWMVLPKLMVRGLEILSPTPTTPRIPPAILNRWLLSLCRAEQSLTKRLGFLWGSSLLLVARAPGGEPSHESSHAPGS